MSRKCAYRHTQPASPPAGNNNKEGSCSKERKT